MRCLVAATLLASISALAADFRYGVAATTQVRTRSALPGDVGTGVTGDLELDPVLELGVLFHSTAAISFQYAPVLIWREPQTGGRFLPLQRAKLSFGGRWERSSLLFSQDGAYGFADIGALRTDDTAQPGSVSAVQTLGGVPYLRSFSALAFESQPDSRTSYSLSGGFSVSGSPGAEPNATNAMPLQFGPVAGARFRWQATRLDSFTTSANFTSAQFLSGAEQQIASLTESWDRQLWHTWSMSVGLGGAYAREVVLPPVANPGIYLSLLPVVSFGTAWADKLLGGAFRLSGSARLTPFADRFTSLVYERVEGRLQADWKPAREWALTVATSAAQAVPLGRLDQAGDRLVSGEGSVTWNPVRWLLLQGSLRVLWTEQPRLGVPGQTQAVGTVLVTVKEQDSVAW